MISNEFKIAALRQKQSLPLEAKICLSQIRIKEWFDYYDGNVYIAFSGGKDSTVLRDIVRNTTGVYDVPSVFVNTGLEYPEIQRFVNECKERDGDVEIIYPDTKFQDVLKEYGYPLFSKVVCNTVRLAKENIKQGKETLRVKQLKGISIKGNTGDKSKFNKEKYAFLLNAPFKVSEQCCDLMKKDPFKKYDKQTGRKPITGEMADESRNRLNSYINRGGCNAFKSKLPKSTPLAFWTEQDVLEYLYTKKIPYASIYGEIKRDERGMYYTTGEKRTGCIFCGFGCHMKDDNRFVNLKEKHPKQYEYCIKGGCINENGMIVPSDGGLGLGMVFDAVKEATHGKINVEY